MNQNLHQYIHRIKSPVFRDTENRKNSRNSGRTLMFSEFTEFHGKRNFWCKNNQNTENTAKQIMLAKTNQTKLCMHLKFCIKPVCGVYACFSCHVFTVYNCSVICFVHVTEDHGIWSSEHRRTRIWQFRKQKTGDFFFCKKALKFLLLHSQASWIHRASGAAWSCCWLAPRWPLTPGPGCRGSAGGQSACHG